MTDGNLGNSEQVRVIAEQIADVAITRFARSHTESFSSTPRPADVPAPLKWAGGIAAAVLTLAASSGLLWLVTTVNTMQVTLARMDQRMIAQQETGDSKYIDLERRLTSLEMTRKDNGQ